MRSLTVILALILSLSACSPGADPATHELSKALTTALINGRIQNDKISEILAEHSKLSDEESRLYSNKIVAIVSLGGDSTKIDAARKQFFAAK